MLNFIEDDTRPFDYFERLEGMPDGFRARVVRIAPSLPFDAAVIMPSKLIPGDTDAERSCDSAVLNRAFPDLGSAQDWIMAWVCR